MDSNRKPLCFIPARGGSKRLPRKNMALLRDKPLLALTIESARDSGLFDNVYVSSEDEEILIAAKKWGGIPLRRDTDLAGDRVTLLQLCLKVVKRLADEDGCTDLYLLLPSSPFRRPSSICRAWEQFIEGDADSLISVVPFDHPPQWALTLRDGWVSPMYPEDHNRPRQDLAPAIRHDGGHLITRISSLMEFKTFIGPKTLPFLVSKEESVDINEPMDLLWAEFLIEKGMVK